MLWAHFQQGSFLNKDHKIHMASYSIPYFPWIKYIYTLPMSLLPRKETPVKHDRLKIRPFPNQYIITTDQHSIVTDIGISLQKMPLKAEQWDCFPFPLPTFFFLCVLNNNSQLQSGWQLIENCSFSEKCLLLCTVFITLILTFNTQ